MLLCDYANVIWSFKRQKSPPFFVLFIKIQLHAKDAKIFHFKLSINDRLNYFPTSTLSKCTICHHDQPITCDWLLKWQYFDILFVLTWCLLNFPFFKMPLYIFLICNMFINKILQGFDEIFLFFICSHKKIVIYVPRGSRTPLGSCFEVNLL